MDYNDFVDVIIEVLENEVFEGVSITKTEVIKNNGVRRLGITIREENINACPTIYLEDYYISFNAGKDISEIADDILNCYYKNRLNQDINVEYFNDYEMAKDHLFCKIINRDMNSEILKMIPYEEFLDLAIVVYYRFENFQFGEASIIIKNEHVSNWNINNQRLFEDAKNNTRSKMEMYSANITTMLSEMCNVKEDFTILEEGKIPMYVVSNIQKTLGAVYMIYPDIMKKFGEMLGGDYVVLPSSIHEFLMVPYKNDDSLEMYNSMVKEVNNGNVAMEERLSDHAYLYRLAGGFSV